MYSVTQVFCTHFFSFYESRLLTKDTSIAEMISLFAQSEQNMNAVERVLHYAELPAEGSEDQTIVAPISWPTEGSIQFSDVKLAYREGLPFVLKGVGFKAGGGEKVLFLLLKLISSEIIPEHVCRSVLWDARGPAKAPSFKLSFGNPVCSICSRASVLKF